MLVIRFVIIIGVLFLADFILWTKLREEYSDEEIIKFSVWMGFFLTLGLVLTKIAEGSGTVLGLVAGIYTWCNKQKWVFWEMADVVAPIALLLWLGKNLVYARVQGFVPVIGSLVIIILTGLIRNNYRKFRWYKSGKTGLASLCGLAFYCIFEIGVAFFGTSGIYWWGLKVSQIVFAFLLSYSGVAIYIRSGRKLKEDLSWPLRKNQ